MSRAMRVASKLSVNGGQRFETRVSFYAFALVVAQIDDETLARSAAVTVNKRVVWKVRAIIVFLENSIN
jgi:hypothetical protein